MGKKDNTFNLLCNQMEQEQNNLHNDCASDRIYFVLKLLVISERLRINQGNQKEGEIHLLFVTVKRNTEHCKLHAVLNDIFHDRPPCSACSETIDMLSLMLSLVSHIRKLGRVETHFLLKRIHGSPRCLMHLQKHTQDNRHIFKHNVMYLGMLRM